MHTTFMLPVALLPLLALASSSHASESTPNVTICKGADPHGNQSRIVDAGGCLRSLRENPALYEKCKSNLCFLFLKEEPYNILPADFSGNPEKYQKPFLCRNVSEEHPRISGISFQILEKLSSDAWCVFAGDASDCPFNALVDFVDLQADKGYQFGVSGLLLEMPRRRCRHHISAPIFDDRVAIVGRIEMSRFATSARSSLARLVKPFHWATWAFFACELLVLFLIASLIARCVVAPRSLSWYDTVSIMLGHNIDISRGIRHAPNERQVLSIVRVAMITLLVNASLIALVAIFVLFYEIGVVNSLFQTQELKIGKQVSSLSCEELRKYAVLKNSALENVWESHGELASSYEVNI